MRLKLPILSLLLIFSCDKDTPVTPDTTAPTVVITYPVNGTALTQTETVKVDVADSGEITSVIFLIDGTAVFTDTEAPYEYEWDVCVQGTGSHTVLVKATDSSGNTGQSDLFTFPISATYDCESVCGGTTVVDNCGTCDADSSNDCDMDDCGVWGGENACADDCGVPNGNNSPNTGTCDCAGTPNGDANIDDYGNCCIAIPGGFCDCNSEYLSLWDECYSIENTTELDLFNTGLTGAIPSEIGLLTNLTSLDLSYNQLTGDIPVQIGGLTNLTYLSLGGNQLTGEIPSEIGTLTNLTTLVLDRNQLTGDIPSEIWELTNLTALVLDRNQLTGDIPSEIWELTNLIYLVLDNNQLTGEIPSEIGQLTNLITLVLDRNQLTGDIPSQIGNLTNLTYLNLSYNQLTGSIPSEIGQLTNLTELYLYDNQLTGEIPQEICNQGDNTPSLHSNKLCPPYPDCLSDDDIGEQNTSECAYCIANPDDPDCN